MGAMAIVVINEEITQEGPPIALASHFQVAWRFALRDAFTIGKQINSEPLLKI